MWCCERANDTVSVEAARRQGQVSGKLCLKAELIAVHAGVQGPCFLLGIKVWGHMLGQM